MSLKERDIVLTGKDADGNSTIDLPITRLGNVEGTADVKAAPEQGDYIPLVDSADNGQMKKILVSALAELLGIDVDSALSATSENPVQNKVIQAALNKKAALNEDGVVSVDQGGTGAATLEALTQSIATAVAGSADLAAALGDAIGGCKIQTGSYVGTGTYGASNPCSLTFDFVPKIYGVVGYVTSSNSPGSTEGNLVCTVEQLTTTFAKAMVPVASAWSYGYGKVSADGKTVSWYTTNATNSAQSQNNETGRIYYWYALG